MRLAVLLEKAADGVEPAVEEGDADMVGALRQGRAVSPFVGLGIVDMVLGPVGALLAIAADDVHAVIMGRCPGHFRTRQRQQRLRAPAPGTGGLGRR